MMQSDPPPTAPTYTISASTGEPGLPLFETSESTAKLDAALAKAQGEFAPLVINAFNPHFKSKFADLSSVWSSVRAPLAKHGIAVTQWPLEPGQKRIYLLTRVSHDGEWIQSVTSMPVEQDTPQKHASAYTYLKRAALKAVLGLAEADESLEPDGDDDGENAEGRGDQGAGTTPPAQTERSAPKPGPALSPSQQVTKAMNERRLTPEVVGRWLRARYPRLEYKIMPMQTAAEILKTFAQATDQSLEEDLAKLAKS